MKSVLLLSVLCSHLIATAQYYYKDIIGTRETSALIKNYRNNKVNRVLITSYNADDTRNEDFYVEQQFSSDALKTITRSNVTNESALISFVDPNGNVVKTVDSSEAAVSITTYNYNTAGQLASVTSSSSDTLGTTNEFEEHIWQYNNNKPVIMLRVKNKRDTIYIAFKTDENGNISEEQETNKGIKEQPVYYYYDANNRLTDIVRFNSRAKRLLPEYMFEYSPANQVIQQITVPSNSSDYLIWRYQYDAKGLKVKEAVYNKQKQLTGKIEYQYSFGS